MTYIRLLLYLRKIRNFWRRTWFAEHRDPYLWLFLGMLFLVGGLQTAHYFNLGVISPLHNILRLAGRDAVFSIICLSGTLAVLVLLPCAGRERLYLLGGCIFSEIVFMQLRWGVYSLSGHLAYIGPTSMLVCLVFLVLYLIRYSLLDNLTAWRVLDLMAFSTAMPLLYALYSTEVQELQVYDLLLMKADSLFGFQPSFAIARLLSGNVLVITAMIIVYYYLPVWMMLAQISSFRRDYMDRVIPIMRSPGPPFLVFLAAAAVGAVCYSYLPAVGPAAFFGAKIFPYGTCPDVALSDVKAVVFINDAMRSCIPCLPLVFVLCAGFTVYNIQPFWNRGWFVLAFFMAASSFSIGGHWAVDSLAALPITACCLGLTWYRVPGKIRWITAAGGGISSFLLLHLIKYDIAWCLDHAVLYWLWVISVNVLSVVGIKYMLNVSREHEYHLVVSRQPYRFLTPARKDDEEDE